MAGAGADIGTVVEQAAIKYLEAHPEIVEKLITSLVGLGVDKISDAIAKKQAEKATGK